MSMRIFNWDPNKNQQFMEERNKSFEEVVFHIQNGGLLDDIAHPNEDDYPNQNIFIVGILSALVCVSSPGRSIKKNY